METNGCLIFRHVLFIKRLYNYLSACEFNKGQCFLKDTKTRFFSASLHFDIGPLVRVIATS